VGEILRSVGLDVGTTTTQLIVSELTVENRASGFTVPRLEIVRRRIVYRGGVHFTPLLGEELVDGEGIREIVTAEYRKAGIGREDVDTGAMIITGETSRRENADAVLRSLSDFAGDFVVATAGPDLESVLAAKGAGAVEYSRRTGKNVLHFDIGGGTSNWALIEDGKIIRTGCLNVGGRLMKFDESGKIIYISPVLDGLTSLKVEETATKAQAETVAQMLVQALEMAAGLREKSELLERLITKEANYKEIATPVCGLVRNDRSPPVLSFSGGVADCIGVTFSWLRFGDLGPVLGTAIRESRLCRGEFVLGAETIRATVIGAGCHSAQLSGSTVFCRNVQLPLKNLPVVTDFSALKRLDSPGVLALPGARSPSYADVQAMAAQIAGEMEPPVYIALEADMAKALGHALILRLGQDAQVLCIDRLHLTDGDYLDVGNPIGPALPVVIKTLILEK
jgi:ethanolamine utilization protein EutA